MHRDKVNCRYTASIEETPNFNILAKHVKEIKVVHKKNAENVTHYHAKMVQNVYLEPGVPMVIKLLLVMMNMMTEKMERNWKIWRKK